MSNELVYLVKNAERKTKVKVYLQTKKYDEFPFAIYDQIIVADYDEVRPFLDSLKFEQMHIETLSRKSALGLQDVFDMDARIEPGALIRNGATVEKDAIVLMGAVINVGAHIGSWTMVDMNAVIGSGAQIGKRCHIGAGAVIAGMMEPAGTKSVVIEDDVFVGANAVILEEITVGHHSIIGAGAVVTKNVEPYSVMAGVPAVKIKENGQDTMIEQDLRGQ